MSEEIELQKVVEKISDTLEGKPGSFAAEALIMCLAGFILATVEPTNQSKAIVVAMKALREMVKSGQQAMRETMQ